MKANSFGTLFTMTTWGESHGEYIGVVIDGCPAGVEISVQDVEKELKRHRRFTLPFVTLRRETMTPQIVSGLFEGKTTGAPLSILLPNCDHRSSDYECVKDVFRPGHANYTYLQKYGIFDYRGGGRASARETAARIAAGAIAKKILSFSNIQVVAYVSQIGPIILENPPDTYDKVVEEMSRKNAFCPDPAVNARMRSFVRTIQRQGDSIGGCVEFCTTNVPVGLGDPIYEKLDARLAFALMSIPGVKGIEIGSGRSVVAMKGSEHNDRYVVKEGSVQTQTNNCGGILGGISTGMPIFGRVYCKPPSSIALPMSTVSLEGKAAIAQFTKGFRHDACIAIRALTVVEAMVAFVIVDSMLASKGAVL